MSSASRRGGRFRRSQGSASLARRAVTGIVPGDHVCASFGSDEQHEALVGRYARQALRRGERFLYLAHASTSARIGAILEHEGLDVEAGLALGQIEIRQLGHGRDAIGGEQIVAALQADRRSALRDGYSALCTASEMSWALARPERLDAVVRYEHAVDRAFAGAVVAGICQYDRRLFAPEMLERLVSTHGFQICTDARIATTARRRLTISEQDDGAIALSGALDIDSADYLATRLAEIGGERDLVLLTSGLGFADVTGCRALVQAAAQLGGGRRLVLPEASEPLVRVLELCGWSSHGSLMLV